MHFQHNYVYKLCFWALRMVFFFNKCQTAVERMHVHRNTSFRIPNIQCKSHMFVLTLLCKTEFLKRLALDFFYKYP